MKEDGTEVAIARVVIPKDDCDEHDGNLVTPMKTCTLITTSGQLWDITVSTFHAREELLRESFNTQPSQFKKRDTQ